MSLSAYVKHMNGMERYGLRESNQNLFLCKCGVELPPEQTSKASSVSAICPTSVILRTLCKTHPEPQTHKRVSRLAFLPVDILKALLQRGDFGLISEHVNTHHDGMLSLQYSALRNHMGY